MIRLGFWLLAVVTAAFAEINHESKVESYGSVKVLSLHGSHYAMGLFYGRSLSLELCSTLAILKEFFVDRMGMSYDQMLSQAGDFTVRYGYEYVSFLQGMADGSGLSYGDCQVLNAMETIAPTNATSTRLGQCAFMAIPAGKSASGGILVGRNYDYPEPFYRIAKYLTITLIFDKNRLPTAIIALPGQIYCPTCINSAGVFLELNNGMPSGGSTVATDRFSMLINMLQILQQSQTADQVALHLKSAESDFSLILNVADSTTTRSFEFSSVQGSKPFMPDPQETFVSTNYYLNDSWVGTIPVPKDKDTWMGVTRRNNLLNLADQFDRIDLQTLKAIMDRRLLDGGAKWDWTIYQLVFDTKLLKLFVRISGTGDDWIGIPLGDLFRSV